MDSHTLPDFLIIGAMRSGTSWLARLLSSHPQIFIPNVETHFFDQHYNKGLKWYAKHFPQNKQNAILVGEKTPSYLSGQNIPARVKADLPEARFIAILRDPVERAISHFKNHCQYTGYQGSFDTFMEEHPDAFEKGLYARQIRQWLEHFPRDRFCFFIFERVTKNPQEIYSTIGDFLNVDEDQFDMEQAGKQVNASYTPAFHSLYLVGSRINKFFFRRGCHRVSRSIVRCGQVFKLLSKQKDDSDHVPEETKNALRKRYRDDVQYLERLLGETIPEWERRYGL